MEPEIEARDFDLDARFIEDFEADAVDARDWEDILGSIDLRSLSEEDLIALNSRGIGGILKVSSSV